MTQFIMFEGNPSETSIPEEIDVLSICDDEFLWRAGKKLFPAAKRSRLFCISEKRSGSADALLDEIHNRLAVGRDIENIPVIGYLKHLLDCGFEFVCWYGDEWQDLTIVRGCNQFVDFVRNEASHQPPELYVRVLLSDID